MEKIRLQKLIADYGYCSRRKAEELILQGRVKVNDDVVVELGRKFVKEDIIKIDDKVINTDKKEHVYYLLNKPREYICTRDDPQHRKTIFSLIDDSSRLFYAGRLDYLSEGLIIVTDDGEFSNLITHPSTSLEKEYIAVCKNNFKGDEIKKLEEGLYVTRRGYKAYPCKATLIEDNKKEKTSTYSIILHEGKKRQVRDMMSSLSHPVISLTRVRIGPLVIGRMKEKEYVKIDSSTIEEIKKLCTNKKDNIEK